MIWMLAGLTIFGALEMLTGAKESQKFQGGTIVLVSSFLIVFKFLQMWFG